MLGITTSAVISEESKDWNITKIITFGLSYPKYFLSNKKCQLKALRFYRKPEVHMAKKIWNLPENGMTREMVKLKLKGIVTNQKIYIPIERNEVPESIYFENKDSIQVRILHNEDMIFKNRGDERMKSKVGFCCTSSTK